MRNRMVHGGINIYQLKDNATRTVLVRVAFLLLCISEILLRS